MSLLVPQKKIISHGLAVDPEDYVDIISLVAQKKVSELIRKLMAIFIPEFIMSTMTKTQILDSAEWSTTLSAIIGKYSLIHNLKTLKACVKEKTGVEESFIHSKITSKLGDMKNHQGPLQNAENVKRQSEDDGSAGSF